MWYVRKKCIVFDLFDVNVYKYIKDQHFKGLDIGAVRKIAIQLLYSLNFLYGHNIIHCDLKPENIIFRQYGKTGIKVIDFGSSCFKNEKIYSYIQSRFYRAPEILMGLSYGLEIDMWSFGCIIAELYTGVPIFPGENESEQMALFMEYLNAPSRNMIELSRKRAKYFDDNYKPLLVKNSSGTLRLPGSKNIENFLKGADDLFVDLVRKCLEWEPAKRIKPFEAMMHEWVLQELPANMIEFHKSNAEKNMPKKEEPSKERNDGGNKSGQVEKGVTSNFQMFKKQTKTILKKSEKSKTVMQNKK